MRSTVLAMITVLMILPARAQPPPSDFELLVAYCFGVRRTMMGVLDPGVCPEGRSPPPNLSSSGMKAWRDLCKSEHDQRRDLEREINRLRMYLLAKRMDTNPAVGQKLAL